MGTTARFSGEPAGVILMGMIIPTKGRQSFGRNHWRDIVEHPYSVLYQPLFC